MPAKKEKKSFVFPVSTLIGSNYSNFKKVLKGREISKGYKSRYFFTKWVAWILDWFRLLEERKYGKKIEKQTIDKPPIFIIGFWRSGTTLLHNLMCQNPDFAFINTFQAVFPNHCLLNQGWLKRIASVLMPDRRPGDNLKIDFAYPQEEEIALGNLQSLSFYYFFYFPQDTEEFLKQSLLFENVSPEDYELWKSSYETLIKTALINTGGKQFISKNPPNTYRVKQLLEMFPNARFVYIERNIYETLYSFIRFTHAVREGIKHQTYNEEKQERLLVEIYRILKEKYTEERNLIPEGQLVELEFEHFEKNKMSEMKRVYETLGIEDFEKAKPYMESYLNDLGDYKRREHNLDKDFIAMVDEIMGKKNQGKT